MICLKCKKPMRNLGNINNITLASYPPQWDEVWVCDADQLKKTIRVRGETINQQPDLTNYKEANTPPKDNEVKKG